MNLWLKERFPPINFISGFILYLLAKAIIVLSDNTLNMSYGVKDLYGLLIPAMHLFLLRVFDEHKDFETDRDFYPERVIQRGIFKLTEVAQLGYLAFIVQIYSFYKMQPSLLANYTYLFVWIWTLLMTKEFFAKDWLKSKLLLYGISHLLITPFLFFLLLTICSPEFSFSPSSVLALTLSLLTGWLYEVTRKTKAPNEETGDLTYSGLWGIKLATFVISCSSIFTAIITIFFFRSLKLTHPIYILIQLGLIILSLLLHYRFLHEPTAKNRKKNEGASALLSAYAFLTPLVGSFFL
jgi:4-hydroxybenzoate polyprenyltransferase